MPPVKTCKPKQTLVVCATCAHFHRDTSGPSRNAETGIYFMGESDIHCDPDHTFNERRGTAKIFADKPRICNLYKQAQ
jgi:hypothetical protein